MQKLSKFLTVEGHSSGKLTVSLQSEVVSMKSFFRDLTNLRGVAADECLCACLHGCKNCGLLVCRGNNFPMCTLVFRMQLFQAPANPARRVNHVKLCRWMASDCSVS